MDTSVEQFLKSHKIAVLSVLQADNKVHAASLHYAFSLDPLRFYFMTHRMTKKVESLLNGTEQNASLVIGFDQEEFVTLQAQGTVAVVSDADRTTANEIYDQKFPDRIAWHQNPDMLMLRFTPTWWRWRDYKANPPTEFTSS